MNRPRIAFFARALNAGGAQRVTVNLANGLSARGFEVDVVLAHATGEMVGQLAAEVTVVDLQTSEVPVVGVATSGPALVRYLRARRPSVLFSVMMYVNDVAIPAVRLARVPTAVVPTEHTTRGMLDAPKERLVVRLASALYPLADHVVAVSDGVADSVVEHTGISTEDVSVIYNPVVTPDVREKASETPDHPWFGSDFDVILNAGRLVPEKDQGTLLRAFARLARDRPGTRLVILGEGSIRTDLERLARKLDVEERVSMPGFVENPYGFMRRAAVYALSSRREGLPSTLIEAMACGCPVVATDCPSGPREILRDGRLGPLVPVGDEAALADAIGRVLDDPPDAELLVDRTARFSRDAVLDEYEDLIDRLEPRQESHATDS